MFHALIFMLPMLFVDSLDGMLTPAGTGLVSYTQTADGVTITLPEVEDVTEFNRPRLVMCEVKNENDAAVSVRLRFYSTDTILISADRKISPEAEKTMEVAAKSTANVTFLFLAGPGTLSALYPLSVDAEFQLPEREISRLRAVRVIKTDFSGVSAAEQGKLEFLQVPKEGKIFLTSERNYAAFRTELTAGNEAQRSDRMEVENDSAILSGRSAPLRVAPVPAAMWIPLPGRGWTGNCEISRASLQYHDASPGGETRRALHLHPPYVPKGGSLFLEYPVELPELAADSVMEFSHGVAIRETAPHEPKSDGVTFRVWVRDADSPREENVLLDEIHTESKTWVDRTVNLAEWAGRRVILTLEVNPGPKNDTTCDGCFWSGLAIYHGPKRPEPLGEMWRRVVHVCVGEFFAAEDLRKGKDSFVMFFRGADSGYRVPPISCLSTGNGEMRMIMVPGNQGLIDGVIGIGTRDKFVIFDGIKVAVDGISLGDAPHDISAFSDGFIGWEKAGEMLGVPVCLFTHAGRKYTLLTVFDTRGDDGFTLDVRIAPRKDNADLPACVADPITSISFGPASVKAKNVYFGHGYVVRKPKGRSEINAGGHALATSHVGMDFENGLSLLMASKTPPSSFVVDADRRIYTLKVHPGTTFTLIPGTRGAMELAVKYRPLFENVFGNQPSSQVSRKAGRLVFDVWGRSFADCRKELEKAVKYGVTDALFIQHCWQRWGYDVRLPDIWEPEARAGTVAELRELEAFCRENGIPFALHDNYIDFYPDATDYSYRYITRRADGTPVLAWNNTWAGAQSYQWRPDLFKPFLAKNMELAERFLPEMDAYFVDVFASINIIDFYDETGVRHSPLETLDRWGNCFQVIRNDGSDKDADAKKYDRPQTITISEAGSDFLIGALDGADVQWLELTPEYEDFTLRFPCEDWERTPWFAPVNHTRFSLHGVGYSNRYEGGRPAVLHDAGSDDYLSMEMLSGNSLMTETWSIFPFSVRKTWLAQHVIRRLADKEIMSVVFQNGNIHHQKVTWSDGTTVFVNRDKDVLNVLKVETADGGISLGTYHFAVLDKSGKLISAIHQTFSPDGKLSGSVEFSRAQFPSFGGVPEGRGGDSPPAEGWLRSSRGGLGSPQGDSDHPALTGTPPEEGNFGEMLYLNGRGYSRSGMVDITPRFAGMKVTGEREFQVEVDWEAHTPTAGEREIFIHIFKLEQGTKEPNQPGWVAGGERPAVPTTEWGVAQKTYRSGTRNIMRVPENLPDGDYQILVGLYAARGNGNRESLMARDTGGHRYSVATLHVNRTPDGKTELSATPAETVLPPEYASLTANTVPFTVDGITTRGGIRVVKSAENSQWMITPLPIPNLKRFEVSVEEKTAGKGPVMITARTQDRTSCQTVNYVHENGKITWEVDSEEFFDYEILWEYR